MATKNTSELLERLRQLRSAFAPLGLAFLSGHPQYPSEGEVEASRTKINLLRDSILFRFESLVFHQQIILDRHRSLVQESRQSLLNHDAWKVAYFGSRDLKFLFDDVVFNIISLFDYFGTLIGFTFHPTIGNIKWAGARRFSQNNLVRLKPDGPDVHSRLYGTRVAAAILDLNNEWLKGLAEYRNALIHERGDFAKGDITFHFTQGEPLRTTLNVAVPDGFVKRVRPTCYTDAGDPPQVPSVSWRLISLTCEGCISLLDALSNHLNSDTKME